MNYGEDFRLQYYRLIRNFLWYETIHKVKIDSRRGGGEGTPYNGLYGEAPPKSGTFFRLQVYKRVGISQVEVYKRVGKSII